MCLSGLHVLSVPLHAKTTFHRGLFALISAFYSAYVLEILLQAK